MLRVLREARCERKTSETRVIVEVNIDGSGKANVETPMAFLNHMLTCLSTHSLIDIQIKAEGDLGHHVSEDTALSLGATIDEALGDRKGICRFGFASVPMDRSLAECAVDLSGRPCSVIDLNMTGETVEDTSVEDLSHFLESLATSLGANIHVAVRYGHNDHHKAEAAFKALALSLRQAASIDHLRKGVPSSKGVM